MSVAKKATEKIRKPNPSCGAEGCSHPRSFHPRDEKKHRRPCKAFGCKCKNFTTREDPQ